MKNIELKVVHFDNEDVIATSNGNGGFDPNDSCVNANGLAIGLGFDNVAVILPAKEENANNPGNIQIERGALYHLDAHGNIVDKCNHPDEDYVTHHPSLINYGK